MKIPFFLLLLMDHHHDDTDWLMLFNPENIRKYPKFQTITVEIE